MIKNIFIHLVFSAAVSLFAANILTEHTYCESMCGFYFIYSAFLLFPAFFLLGLAVPIGLKKYPKSNLENSSKFKRKMCLVFGGIGMLGIFLFFVMYFYVSANNKHNKSIQVSNVHSASELAPWDAP